MQLGEFAADFAHYNDDILFGENWNNQDIDVKPRSIITVILKNYNEAIIQAKNEIDKKYTPELKSVVSDIEKYGTVFLGTPNWWGGLPPAVHSFIKFYNLPGKKMILFIIHGGGVQNIMKEIEELCPDCIIEKNIWVGYGNRTA